MDGDGNRRPRGPPSCSGHGEDSDGVNATLLEHRSQLKHLPTTATIKQEVLSECEQDDEEDTGSSCDQESEALPVAVKLEVVDEFDYMPIAAKPDAVDDFAAWPTAVKRELELPEIPERGSDRDVGDKNGVVDTTNRELVLSPAIDNHFEKTDQSNVELVAGVIEPDEDSIITKEMQSKFPPNDGVSSEEAAQLRSGQAVSSSLLAAHRKQAAPLARQKLAATKRKRKKTCAEIFGSEEAVEPMESTNSIVIEKEASRLDSCDRVQNLSQSRGSSGRQPDDAVADNHAESATKVMRVKRKNGMSVNCVDKKKFCCHICEKVFSRKKNLRGHMIGHTGQKPYECPVCRKTFTQMASLSQHVRIHAGERTYRCQVCQMTFEHSGELTAHLKTHAGLKPYECRVCQKTFSLRNSLVLHTRIHTGEKPYKCLVCDKRFTDPSSLTTHGRMHTGERPYECQVCRMAFVTSADLTKHVRTHTGEKPYQCQVCKKTFALSGTLRAHGRIHTGEKPYKCPLCELAFSQKSNLDSHTRHHHANGGESLKEAPEMIIPSITVENEASHLTSGDARGGRAKRSMPRDKSRGGPRGQKSSAVDAKKTKLNVKKPATREIKLDAKKLDAKDKNKAVEKKKFCCHVCGAVFTRSNNLDRHIVNHLGEKPFECRVCNKTFTRLSGLNQHASSHTGEKPYECSVCHLTFARLFSLKCHGRIHTGEKPYECEVCKKTFISRPRLRVHMVIHTGEKPYECRVCQKRFADRSDRNRHARGHARQMADDQHAATDQKSIETPKNRRKTKAEIIDGHVDIEPIIIIH